MDDRRLSISPRQLPVIEPPQLYVCPGEDHPIPRSIHLARLAAYYPKCRDCEHRRDTGQLPRSTVGRLEQTAVRAPRPSPFVAEGIRGEYLNHLTRQIAGRVAAAVADFLWESRPLVGRSMEDDEVSTASTAYANRQAVVVGHDARASSPDLCVGVSRSLRQMGCDVVDVGRVTTPCHAFAVEHLQADAGLFVTGSGCPPQWTGLDIIGPRGVPWSLNNGTLADIERRFLCGVNRPTRLGGSHRYFDALVPYRAGLGKHFRELRPLRIVCAAADSAVLESLTGVFDPLPCDLIPVTDMPVVADPDPLPEVYAKRLRTAVRDSGAACAVALMEDGRGGHFFDETGRPVDSMALLSTVARRARQNSDLLRQNDSDAISREALAARLFDPGAGDAIDAGGRLWLRDAVPLCDVILTIGRLLQMLSDERATLSSLVASFNT